MVQAGVWAFTLVMACGQGAAQPEFLQGQAALCRDTGGAWHGGWLRCNCPAESLFYVDRGCDAVDWDGSVRALRQSRRPSVAHTRQQISNLLAASSSAHMVLDTRSLSDRQVRQWTAWLRHDPSSVLRGMTLPPAHGEAQAVWMLTPPTAQSRQEIERELPVGPAQIVPLDPFFALTDATPARYVPPALPPLDPQVMDAAWWGDALTARRLCLQSNVATPSAPPDAPNARRCQQALSATPMLADTAAQLCGALSAAWLHLHDPIATPWTAGAVHHGWRHGNDQCASECSLASQFNGAEVAVYYTAVLADGVPVRRVLRAGSPLGHELMAFLSPSGSIDSVVVKTRHIPESGYVLHRERWLLNAQWQVLRHDADTLGNRAAFEQALVGWTGDNRLPIDSPNARPSPWGVRAAMIDTGVDPRFVGLRHRLAVPYGTSLAEQLLPEAPFTAPGSPTLRALTLFDERGHGTRVAATLLQNLPGARLHVLRGDDLGFVPVATLQARWQNFLMARAPHVVNISQDYSRLLPDCEAFFGPLVGAMPNTLFVAGAGNDSAPSAHGVCPAGLALSHPNVISVAGATGSRLDPLSNHGAGVTVAASMRQPTVAFASSEADVQGTGHRAWEQGTSYAAAAVANAALRYVAWALEAGAPAPTGAELAAMVQAACSAGHLDVACGGIVPTGEAPRGQRR